MAELILDAPELIRPPSQDELPSCDDIPMETGRHRIQMELLLDALERWLVPRPDGFVAGNMFVYFNPDQVKTYDFRGPDVFVVLGVPKGERRSWVVWEEGKAPDVVIELISDSTAPVDKHAKKLIYQNRLRVPEYFWFHPFNPDDWAGFRLEGGTYQPIPLTPHRQLISQTLGLALTHWHGTYKTITTTWLRWALPDGELLPTAEEAAQQRANQAQQRADQAEQRATEEQQRAEHAESRLRQVVGQLLAQGMSVAEISQLTGLPLTEIEQLSIATNPSDG